MSAICGWYNWDPEPGDELFCANEATHHYSCNVGKGIPICAAHACRCSVTLEEERRRADLQFVPSHWMAL